MACQAASHPETLRGQRYSMPCPTAKNWAPFVRGCAPEDAGANHDMRRVRLLDEQTVLATTGPANQPTGGSVLPSRRPQGLRRLSPADQRPGRITPAGDLTSSSPYPRHLTAMQLLSSSVRSDIEVMSPLDNPSRRSWGIAHRMATLQRLPTFATASRTHAYSQQAVSGSHAGETHGVGSSGFWSRKNRRTNTCNGKFPRAFLHNLTKLQ